MNDSTISFNKDKVNSYSESIYQTIKVLQADCGQLNPIEFTIMLKYLQERYDDDYYDNN